MEEGFKNEKKSKQSNLWIVLNVMISLFVSFMILLFPVLNQFSDNTGLNRDIEGENYFTVHYIFPVLFILLFINFFVTFRIYNKNKLK